MFRSSLGVGLAVALVFRVSSADAQATRASADTTANAPGEPQGKLVTPTPSVDAADVATQRGTGATRRSGFTFGILAGFAAGDASGYPNDFSKLDDPTYHASTTGVGSGLLVYLGGALTDWFTFGMGVSSSTFGSSHIESHSTAFLFHVETFPLFARGRIYRDLGLFADVGTGTATLKRKEDGAQFSSSGSLSIFGVGAVWEALRLGDHVALGPYAAWRYAASDAMTRQFTEVGVRAVFYGGP